MVKGKAFVLLSGGIDSTTCLYLAHREFSVVEAVSIDYGQRHSREIEHAAKSCTHLHCQHTVLPVRNIVPRTMLTDTAMLLPNISYEEISGVSPTYVPYRNGLMLSALASYAAGQVADNTSECGIYFGAHAEDAQNWAYPDCTPEFIGAMANAIYVGTYRQIRLHTPLQWLNKWQIVKLGAALGVVFGKTWSCYAGGDKHCGTCPTCRARKKGFQLAGISDPTEYAAAAQSAA